MRLRAFLSLPVFAIYVVALVLGLVLSGIGRALRFAGKGWYLHVTYTILQTHRRVLGERPWQPVDIYEGIGPQTDYDRQRLEAFAVLIDHVVLYRPEGVAGAPVLVPKSDMTNVVPLTLSEVVAANERANDRAHEASGEIDTDATHRDHDDLPPAA